MTPDQVYFNHETTATLKAVADPGFVFSGWEGDASGNQNPLTITMNSKKVITARFTNNANFTITAQAGENGSISPSGTTTLSYGESKTYTISPNAGYHVEDVVVDGVSRGGYTTYTFNRVTDSHSITAIFAAGEINQPMKPETFDVPYDAPKGGKTWTVNQGDDLQAAINGAALGDVIVLQAGATFRAPSIPFSLPYKRGSGWIYIISSELNRLQEGRRVTPADAVYMPKIVAADNPNGLPALATLFGAHHFRLAGIEIISENTKGGTYNLVLHGYGLKHPDDSHWLRKAASSSDEMPHHIVYDRCYIHSTGNNYFSRTGINANGSYIAIIDSRIENFKDGSDAQAIQVYDGAGPYKIVNNFLEATGENIMFGGTDPAIQNLVPSNIEVRGNHCFKRLAWKFNDPSYAGKNWTIKNLFELKNAERILVTGNVFENNWSVTGQHSGGQKGTAIVLTVRNQSGAAPWSVVRDLTFENNIIRNVGYGFRLTGSDDVHPSQGTTRIRIHNNAFESLRADYYGGVGMGLSSRVNHPGLDVRISHNLFAFGPSPDTSTGSWGVMIEYGAGVIMRRIAIENNLAMNGNYGIMGSNLGPGLNSLNYYLADYSITHNVIINRPCDLYYGQRGLPSAWYPAGNFFPDGNSSVGFTDYLNGNYRLLSSSPYHNAGTDGKDIGPDWDKLNAATAHAVDGNSYASYTLVVAAQNGMVTKNPDWTSYRANSQVTLTAKANAGYRFSGWSGDAEGSSNPLTVMMDRNKSITANFIDTMAPKAPSNLRVK
ncbi:MAG: hypothetical protein GX589_09810 [Deltaproteobacteria bacterium]|nr:hypothetical protein [Deltaproteobacteria bacterium]